MIVNHNQIQRLGKPSFIYNNTMTDTPMMQQYNAIKKKHKDSILFFAWAIFTKCFIKMQQRHRLYWG